ncbi:serine hydrolase [Microtetraspora sp. NBRC 16547]|uniref:D-alanyl-D-alanine carboxypeptidase family protein n=1 Tax=Microtetraspora sp. NBRC 16547 TaxID=3030993 RepID=UPI0024A3067B|nr:serine hydrolase [Microtetraspora sp. NBRC 16547]GLW98723.1 D-alanyl-D-alanine carboxypeptidase [Microtetraspora sp. NBRC 16547]
MRIGLIGALSAAVLAFGSVGPAAATASAIPSTASSVTASSVTVPMGIPAAATVRDAPTVTARAAYLVDTTAETVPFAKRDTRRVPVASLTKVMTAYVVRQEASLDDVITITAADVMHAVTGGATSGGLRPGERLTVRELLYALMLPSGADASHALAERYGPGTRGFVDKMNAAAAKLGLRDTRYANPDGLPAKGGYSTARDQVALARIALDDPVIAVIAKKRTHTVAASKVHRAHVWRNTNTLLGYGAIGLKTGYTAAAGFCLTFAAVRNEHTFVGVVLGEASEASRLATARKLLDWAGEEVSDA